jgi:hypothetical protein
MSIPKHFHFVWWQGKDKMPDYGKENVAKWTKLHPDYKVTVWSKSTLDPIVKREFPEYWEAWQSMEHLVQNVDLAKLLLLYLFGGFYIDMDMKCVKRIPDHLLTYKLVISRMAVKDMCDGHESCWITSLFLSSSIPLNNGFFGAVPYNVDLKKATVAGVENLDTAPKWLGKDYYIGATLGPTFFSSWGHKEKWQDRKDILILPEECCEPCGKYYDYTSDIKECRFSDQTFAFHDHAMTWMGEGSKFILWCVYYKRAIVTVITLIVIFIVLWLLMPKSCRGSS